MHIFGSLKKVLVISITAHQHLPPKIGKVTQCQKTKNQTKKTQPQEDDISTYTRLKEVTHKKDQHWRTWGLLFLTICTDMCTHKQALTANSSEENYQEQSGEKTKEKCNSA